MTSCGSCLLTLTSAKCDLELDCLVEPKENSLKRVLQCCPTYGAVFQTSHFIYYSGTTVKFLVKSRIQMPSYNLFEGQCILSDLLRSLKSYPNEVLLSNI